MSHDVHALVGAYVADALEADERAEFEAHLAGCQQCAQEVAEFTETLGRLSVLTEASPPPELKTSVLDAIGQVRPLPPLPAVPTPAEAAPRRAVTSEDQTSRDETSRDEVPGTGSTGPGSAGPMAPAPVDELARRRQRRLTRGLTAAVAAAVVLVLALGGWAASLQQRVDTVGGRTSEEIAVLSAPDAEVVSFELPDGGQASYALSRQQDRAMLITPELPETETGTAYQLWTMQVDEAGDPVLASITPNDTFAGGDDLTVLFDGVRDTEALAVTVEDADGAQTPTMATLFGLALV